MKLDIQTYRLKRAASDISNIQSDIVEALSNLHNIALWKQGVETPDYTTVSQSYSHFHGFRNVTIDRATALAHTGDRFIANKVEHVLDPTAIQQFLNSVNTAQEDMLFKSAQDFIHQRFMAVQNVSPKMS